VPLSPHGVAKKVVVDYLAAYRETHAIEFTALVLAEVYGPRRRSGLVAGWLAQIQAGEPCTIDGSGLDTLDLVFVDDVVDAFVRAADKGSGLVVNIGTGVETSVADLLAHVARLAGATSERAGAKAAKGAEPNRFALDHGRARIHLGWKPWTSLDDGLRQVIDQSRT
jgi:UDP-glucose 4-epimerase